MKTCWQLRAIGGAPIFRYFDGEDDWTLQENARVYHVKEEARAKAHEVVGLLPEGCKDVMIEGVWCNEH